MYWRTTDYDASCAVKYTIVVMSGDFEIQVDTINLSKSAEGILRLNSAFKVACIVQEVADTKQEYHHMRSVYNKEANVTECTISSLIETILHML